jgi:hypothetical protein
MRWARHVARMGRRGTDIGYWWEAQIDLGELGCDGVNWICRAQNGRSGVLL